MLKINYWWNPPFNRTWEYKKYYEGLNIYEELDFILKRNDETDLPASIARAIETSAICLRTLQPDIAVVLGDRFEALGFGLLVLA